DTDHSTNPSAEESVKLVTDGPQARHGRRPCTLGTLSSRCSRDGLRAPRPGQGPDRSRRTRVALGEADPRDSPQVHSLGVAAGLATNLGTPPDPPGTGTGALPRTAVACPWAIRLEAPEAPGRVVGYASP